jgi:hypothetical protein
MVIFIKGRLAKGANWFEVEKRAVGALRAALEKLGDVRQLSPVVVPTFQVGSLIVEIYDKFVRAGRGRFERFLVVAIGDESNDGKGEVIEVKGACRVVPTAIRIIKRLLS